MRFTLHSRHRMARRGIPQRLVDFALQHGRIEGDRAVLDRQETKRIVAALQAELRDALQANHCVAIQPQQYPADDIHITVGILKPQGDWTP